MAKRSQQKPPRCSNDRDVMALASAFDASTGILDSAKPVPESGARKRPIFHPTPTENVPVTDQPDEASATNCDRQLNRRLL
jgi:hypothetical protein